MSGSNNSGRRFGRQKRSWFSDRIVWWCTTGDHATTQHHDDPDDGKDQSPVAHAHLIRKQTSVEQGTRQELAIAAPSERSVVSAPRVEGEEVPRSVRQPKGSG